MHNKAIKNRQQAGWTSVTTLVFFDCYEYDERYYEGTEEGAIITVTLFGIYEGASTSRKFASFLGIDDAWDFNQHKIDPSKIDREGLIDFGNRYTDYDEDCEYFLKLIDNGYEFHFLPNG